MIRQRREEAGWIRYLVWAGRRVWRCYAGIKNCFLWGSTHWADKETILFDQHSDSEEGVVLVSQLVNIPNHTPTTQTLTHRQTCTETQEHISSHLQLLFTTLTQSGRKLELILSGISQLKEILLNFSGHLHLISDISCFQLNVLTT